MRAHSPHLRSVPRRELGYLQHDAANIFVREEIPARELGEIVERALYVEEERIAAPTGKEPVITGLASHVPRALSRPALPQR